MAENDSFRNKWEEEIKPKVDYFINRRYGKISLAAFIIGVFCVVFGVIFGSIYQAENPQDYYEWERYVANEGVSILQQEESALGQGESKLDATKGALTQEEGTGLQGETPPAGGNDAETGNSPIRSLPVQRAVLGVRKAQDEQSLQDEYRDLMIERYRNKAGSDWERAMKKDLLLDKIKLTPEQFHDIWGDPFGDVVNELEVNEQEQQELIKELQQEGH